jgi:hypothetical protein
MWTRQQSDSVVVLGYWRRLLDVGYNLFLPKRRYLPPNVDGIVAQEIKIVNFTAFEASDLTQCRSCVFLT